MTTVPQTPAQTWALHMLSTAKGYVGEDRAHNKDQISKFLGLFGLNFADVNGTPYPFCAAGVSYCAVKALADVRKVPYTAENSVNVFRTLLDGLQAEHFKPSASCGEIVDDAKKRGNWYGPTRPAHLLQPGWLVFYDFAKAGYADHVEIIKFAQVSITDNVGFNTTNENNANGGAVALRTRGYGSVFGYVKTY